MSLFAKKTGWRKIIVTTALMDWKEFDALAWDLVDHASDTWHEPIFFSRYSDQQTGMRIEIQTRTDFPDDVLTSFFTVYGQERGVIKVEATSSGGSEAHAAAYALSRLLRGKGEELTKDVMHWMLNMTGYSYPQEIRLMSEQAATMAANLERIGVGL